MVTPLPADALRYVGDERGLALRLPPLLLQLLLASGDDDINRCGEGEGVKRVTEILRW